LAKQQQITRRALGLLTGAPALGLAAPGSAPLRDPSPRIMRIRLFWAHVVTEAALNGEPVKAPVAKQIPGPVRVEAKGLRPITIPGPVDASSIGNRIFLTANVPLEFYVAAVMAGEVNGVRNEETLKAMAVAIRTYAVRFRNAHRGEGYDLCDSAHCQAAHFWMTQPMHHRAAEQTEGLMLWWKGEPAATYYSAHCGGRSEASPYGAYLNVHDDAYCLARGNDQWRASFTAEQVAQALKLTSTAQSLEIAQRSASGRVNAVVVNGRRFVGASFQASMGRTFGWSIKSLLFDVHKAGDNYVFSGRGRGHGVGICQIGAIRMGEQGRTMREILDFYYPGAKLGLTAQGLDWQIRQSPRIELQTTDPARDERLIGLTEQALQEAERRTGFRFFGKAHVKMYPSVAAYRNSTGESGLVAASVRGAVIRLQPLPFDSLGPVLLHECLHLVLESHAYPKHPWWFREGLALCLAGSRNEASESYRAAREQVSRLIQEVGKEQTLVFWRQGLPAAAARKFEPAGDKQHKGDQ
jgi:stage II sporulation protein D